MRPTQTRLDGGVNVPVVYAGAGTEGWWPCPGPHPLTGHSWAEDDR